MQFQKSLMEDEKIDKKEVWSAIRYLDPDEREKDKEAQYSHHNRNIGSSAYRWQCLGFTLVSSRTAVMRFTARSAGMATWRSGNVRAVSVFLDDKYCLVVNLVSFSSLEQTIVFPRSKFEQSIADVLC